MTAVYAEQPAPRRGGWDVGPVEGWCDRYAPLVSAPRASARAQRTVLRAIAWHMDRWGQGAYASVEQLVERSGCSESTVHRCRRALAEAGRITVAARPGRGTANAFTVPLGTGVTATGLHVVEDGPRDTPTGPGEHDRPSTVTPEVVVSSCSKGDTPVPLASDGEPAAPALVAQAAPTPGAASGSLGCLHARRRGRLCANCRACGTSRRAVERAAKAAAALAAARELGPRLTECATCQDPVRSSAPDPVYCRAHQPSTWQQAPLDGGGAGPGGDAPDGLQDGQHDPLAGRCGPYGPGAGS